MTEHPLVLSDYGQEFSRNTNVITLLKDLFATLVDKSLINLGGGGPSLGQKILTILNDEMKKTINQEDPVELHSYGDARGYRSLRNAFAEMLNKRYDWRIDPDKNLLAFPGSTLAGREVINYFSGPKGNRMLKAVVHSPEYIGYEGQPLKGSDNTFIGINQKIDKGTNGSFSFSPDLDLFKKTLQLPDVNLYIASRPVNPTTQVLDQELFEKMVTSAVNTGKVVGIDNTYGNPYAALVKDGVHCVPVFGKRIVNLFSFSKDALAGHRDCVIVSTEEIIDGLTPPFCSMYNGVTRSLFHAPNYEQALVATMIKDGSLDKIAGILREYYQKVADTVLRRFRKECVNEGSVLIHRFDGAFYYFFGPQDLPKGVTSRTIKEFLRKEDYKTNIVTADGFFYGQLINEDTGFLGYDPGELRRNSFRICLSHPRVEEGVVNIAQCLDHFYRTKG